MADWATAVVTLKSWVVTYSDIAPMPVDCDSVSAHLDTALKTDVPLHHLVDNGGAESAKEEKLPADVAVSVTGSLKSCTAEIGGSDHTCECI